jgi:hypothetical protein
VGFNINKKKASEQLQRQQQQQQQNNLSRYQILPPITPQSGNPQDGYGRQSIDHIIGSEQRSQPELIPPPVSLQPVQTDPTKDIDYLPVDPIYLNPQEEQGLMNDVSRDLGSYSTEQLKRFYSELTTYDPNLTGFTHHAYISLVAMRNYVNNH